MVYGARPDLLAKAGKAAAQDLSRETRLVKLKAKGLRICQLHYQKQKLQLCEAIYSAYRAGLKAVIRWWTGISPLEVKKKEDIKVFSCWFVRSSIMFFYFNQEIKHISIL